MMHPPFCAIFQLHHPPGCPNTQSYRTAIIGSTHTRELDTAVTALGSSALLLQVEITELAAGSLDDADLVGPRDVPVAIFHQYLSILRVIHRATIENWDRGTGDQTYGFRLRCKNEKSQ